MHFLMLDIGQPGRQAKSQPHDRRRRAGSMGDRSIMLAVPSVGLNIFRRARTDA
jgi:hypothetical protein